MLPEVYALVAGLVVLVAWSLYLLRKGASGSQAKTKLEDAQRVHQAEQTFRERLKERRRLVRSWFDGRD